MGKDLRTWVKLGCISRKPKAAARNIIDTRWVIKWKWDQPATSVHADEAKTAEAVRVIRARLTIRGFKDVERDDVDRYAGTSSKISQKPLVTEAAFRRWEISTKDISKAFLQGVAYQELAEIARGKLREVIFYLPARNVAILRKIPGYEKFDPQRDVLHCDKP